MIILREKEFASTKESRKKSKEMNEKDKTRKNLERAQLGTAVGGLGVAGGNIIRASRGDKKIKELAHKHGAIGETILMGDKKTIDAVKRLQNRLIKKTKTANKVAAGLAATSAGLGAVKIARDIKKAKEEKKNK